MNFHEMLVKFNPAVHKSNTGRSGREIKRFPGFEFIVGYAMLIAATCYSVIGSKLWNSIIDDEYDNWETILECPRFEKYIKLYRFKQFRKFLQLVFENDSLKEVDSWWRFKTAIDLFNLIQKERCISSHLKVFDKSMSAFSRSRRITSSSQRNILTRHWQMHRGGACIVIKATHEEIKIVATGYRYSSRKHYIL